MAEREDRDDSNHADGDTKRDEARSEQRESAERDNGDRQDSDSKGSDSKGSNGKGSDGKGSDRKPADGDDANGEAPRSTRRRRRRGAGELRQALPRIATRVASVILIIGSAFALIHVANIIFYGFDANRDNTVVKLVMTLADNLALGLTDLFTPPNIKLRVLINGGLAAVLWLVIAAVLGRLLRKVG